MTPVKCLTSWLEPPMPHSATSLRSSPPSCCASLWWPSMMALTCQRRENDSSRSGAHSVGFWVFLSVLGDARQGVQCILERCFGVFKTVGNPDTPHQSIPTVRLRENRTPKPCAAFRSTSETTGISVRLGRFASLGERGDSGSAIAPRSETGELEMLLQATRIGNATKRDAVKLPRVWSLVRRIASSIHFAAPPLCFTIRCQEKFRKIEKRLASQHDFFEHGPLLRCPFYTPKRYGQTTPRMQMNC